MTIASLIVNVAANTVQLLKDVAQINGQLGHLTTSASQVGTSMAKMGQQFASVQKIVQGLLGLKIVQWLSSLVLGALAYADALGKMRVTLDIGYQGLQRLENIAAGSDTTVQALTSSILDMQRRLATGDESALGALEKLGFGLEEFMALKGDEQFMAIAKEIGKMQDSVEQNEASYRLFGRSYKEISSALKSDVDKLAGAIGTNTDEQIENVAKVEDQWVALKLTMSRIGLWAASFAVDFDKATFALRDQTFHVDKLSAAYDWLRGRMTLPKVTLGAADNPDNPAAGVAGIFGNTVLPKIGLPGEAALKTIYRDLNDTLQVTQDRFKVMAEKTAADTVEKAKNLAAARALEVGTTQLTDSIAVWQFQLEDTGREMVDVRLKVLDLERSATVGIGNISDATQDMGEAFRAAKKDEISLFGDLATDILKAFQGGGDVLRTGIASIGKQIAKNLLSSMSKEMAESAAGQAMAGALGSLFTLGMSEAIASQQRIFARMQAVVDTVQARITAALNAHAAAIAEANALIETLQGTTETTTQKIGTLRAMTPDLRTALETVFAAKTPQEYADAIGRVNDEVDIAIGKQQALDKALDRLKTSWEILGPTARAQHLGQWATEVSDAIQTVTDNGADLNATIKLAGPELSAIVQAAKRSGTEIPAALRPVLQQAADLGVLFDASGKKIGSLEGYGVSFGSTFEETMGGVKDAMLEVVDVLGDIRDALMGLPSQRTIRINIEEKLIKVGSSMAAKIAQGPSAIGESFHDGGPVGRMLQFAPRAHSGLAVGEVPIIAQRGEVMFSRANVAAMGGVGATESFRRGLGSGRGSVVNISTARLEAQMEALRKEQAAMREAFMGQQRQLPALTAIAARDAMQQQARRR